MRYFSFKKQSCITTYHKITKKQQLSIINDTTQYIITQNNTIQHDEIIYHIFCMKLHKIIHISAQVDIKQFILVEHTACITTYHKITQTQQNEYWFKKKIMYNNMSK